MKKGEETVKDTSKDSNIYSTILHFPCPLMNKQDQGSKLPIKIAYSKVSTEPTNEQ